MRRDRLGGPEHGVSLLELMIGLLVLALVLAAAFSWLVSANRAVATSTDRAVNNAAAQALVDQIDSDVRFADSLAVTGSGTVLSVTSGSSCTEWYSEGGEVVRRTAQSTSSVVTRGVSSMTFSPGAHGYAGLVSLSLVLNQTSSPADSAGVSLNEALSASNMTSQVGNGSCGYS